MEAPIATPPVPPIPAPSGVPPAPAGAPPPIATPPPAAPPAASPAASSSFNVKEMFAGLNWTEIAFGVLGTAALYYTIYYYKFQISNVKSMNNEVQNKLDDLSIKVLDLQSAEKRNSEQGNVGFDGIFY